MKNDIKLYKAIGKADDAMVKDALENGAVGNHRARNIIEAVACVAIICGFVALSIVLQSISRPENKNIAASSGGEAEEETVQETKIAAVDATETEEEIYIAEVTADENGTVKKSGQLDGNTTVIFNKNSAEMINRIYSHPGTSEMRFKLNQTVTEDEYKDFPVLNTNSRITRFYDPDYDVKPVYYDWEQGNRLLTDEEVAEIRKNEKEQGLEGRQCMLPDWYSGTPYVRYDINGYGKEKRIVHIDILDENISVCGLTVNSSLDEAEKVLKDLGFEVTRRAMDFSYGYKTDREYLLAEKDGVWIEFETASEFKGASRSAYQYIDFVSYKDNTVPAVIRMGIDFTYVASDTHHALPQGCEQFDLL